MTGSFEFDFALSEEGEGGNDPSVNANNLDITADIANELISKLTERAEKKLTLVPLVGTFVNLSSKIMSATAGNHWDTISDDTADLVPGV